MPETLRLLNRGYMRRLDIEHIIRRLYTLQCVELIGMSNVGKSALLQLLAETDVWIQELGEAGREFLPVYIDCNRMLGLTEQGFCELVLRCLQETSPELAASPELTAAYNTVVAPNSDFQVPLSFSRGLTTVLKTTNRKLVLLLDEFEDPYLHIDARDQRDGMESLQLEAPGIVAHAQYHRRRHQYAGPPCPPDSASSRSRCCSAPATSVPRARPRSTRPGPSRSPRQSGAT